MKKIIIAIFSFLLCLILFSCGGNTEEDKYVFPYQGNWKGKYTGVQDNGNFTINVNPNGLISGTCTSDVTQETYPMKGTINDTGEFNANVILNISQLNVFTGNVNMTDGSGTWKIQSPLKTGGWTIDRIY